MSDYSTCVYVRLPQRYQKWLQFRTGFVAGLIAGVVLGVSVMTWLSYGMH